MGEQNLRFTATAVLALALADVLADDGIEYNPKLSVLDKGSWTKEDIEQVFENVWPVLQRLPSEKLSTIVSKHQVASDYAETVQARVAPPPHHFDQVQDVFQWILWLRPHERRVVWVASSYSGYQRMPWNRIAGKAGVTVPVTGCKRRDTQSVRRKVMRIYRLAIETIVNRCNEQNFPQRHPGRLVS